MNCREKSHFCCGKFYGCAQSNVQPKFFSYSCANYTWSGQFFFSEAGRGQVKFHCMSLYQNNLYQNKLVSKWLVSQSLSIKLSLGIVAAPDVYPKKIYIYIKNKQTGYMIKQWYWIQFANYHDCSVSHHSKLVWSYRSVICLAAFGINF